MYNCFQLDRIKTALGKPALREELLNLFPTHVFFMNVQNFACTAVKMGQRYFVYRHMLLPVFLDY
jgi:hypothetical protein